jgi:ribosome-associated translation inhibitor RaiA
MQIQVHTDDKVQGGESLNAWVQSEIKDKLARFAEHITRIEAHLSDASATRVGVADKQCTLEARLAGHAPLAVSHEAAKVADAMHGALDKLQRKLDHTLGRARDARGRETLRGTSGE